MRFDNDKPMKKSIDIAHICSMNKMRLILLWLFMSGMLISGKKPGTPIKDVPVPVRVCFETRYPQASTVWHFEQDKKLYSAWLKGKPQKYVCFDMDGNWLYECTKAKPSDLTPQVKESLKAAHPSAKVLEVWHYNSLQFKNVFNIKLKEKDSTFEALYHPEGVIL